jgi:hypothetical protein
MEDLSQTIGASGTGLLSKKGWLLIVGFQPPAARSREQV